MDDDDILLDKAARVGAVGLRLGSMGLGGIPVLILLVLLTDSVTWQIALGYFVVWYLIAYVIYRIGKSRYRGIARHDPRRRRDHPRRRERFFHIEEDYKMAVRRIVDARRKK